MLENMAAEVEVWPVAADETGLWLLSGGNAWRPWTPIPADSDPHGEVELTLARFGALDATRTFHSTSWRPAPPRLVLTYIAVVEAGDAALLRWPDALPITRRLLEDVGKPYHQGPLEPPLPRFVDCLTHGIRHLRLLTDPDGDCYDEAVASALGERWWPHLAGLRPALAGLYSEAHSAA